MKDNGISVSKAIGILLMVLVHSHFSAVGDTFISMFHMPLFFFFSGYCFKEKYLSDARGFMMRRVKGVYVPFVKWGLLFLLLHNVFFYLNIYNGEYGYLENVSRLYDWKDYVLRALSIVTRMGDEEQLLGGYWFLNTLFFGSLVAFGVMRCTRRLVWGGVLLLLLCLVAVRWNLRIPFFNVGKREFLAAFFIISGYWYRRQGFCWECRYGLVLVGLLLVAAGAWLWPCSMLLLTWQKAVPYALTALAGTLSVFSLGRCIAARENVFSRILIYIGEHTLTVLTWHFLCFKLVSLCIILLYGLPVGRLAEFPVIEEYAVSGWWVAYFLVGVGVPLWLPLLKSRK